MSSRQLNVFGKPLQPCSFEPLTGWTRTGLCSFSSQDPGTHIVCGQVTRSFLEFTFSKGNDLITSTRSFPGLQEGQFWCFCVYRWIEAYQADPLLAPRLKLESTHQEVLQYIPPEILLAYRI